ncbi:MAG: MarC family protein [Methylotenera sp.]|nr:MarC family protein [Oligoflexia bacterium]
MLGKFLVSFMAILVAMDIIGTVPLYLGMTRGMEPKERNRVVNTSMLVAFVVAIVFVFLGREIFRHLGIQVFDFKIAGGLVLLLVSLADLAGGPAAVHREASGSTGIVPLAVPLITGPGVLTTLILQVSTVGYFITLAALVTNYAFAWILLRKSENVTRVIGQDGTVVLSKIAALLLAAIAVSMMRSGIFEALSDWMKVAH